MGDDAETERAAEAAGALLGKIDDVVDVVQHTPCAGQNLRALGRKIDMAPTALDQSDAEGALEFLYLHRQRRL